MEGFSFLNADCHDCHYTQNYSQYVSDNFQYQHRKACKRSIVQPDFNVSIILKCFNTTSVSIIDTSIENGKHGN